MFEYAKLRTAPIGPTGPTEGATSGAMAAQESVEGGVEGGMAEVLALVREQEVSYNLGRGFQYLGVKHLASPWYEEY